MSAADRANPTGESIRIDAHELYALSKKLEQAEPKLRRQLNKALRKAANEGVQAARLEVLKEPPSRLGQAHHGIRVYRNKNGGFHTRRVVTSFDEKNGGRSRHTGLRQAIASAITAKVATSNKRETTAMRITMNGNKVPQGAGVAKAYNKGKPFRHPVFPDPSKSRDQWSWAYQQGRPYFGSVLLAHREQMLRNVAAAMDDFADKF